MKKNKTTKPKNQDKIMLDIKKGSGITYRSFDNPSKKSASDEEKQESKIRKLLETSKLDPTKEYPEPKFILNINDQKFGTLGNFSLVLGKAKSKKTFFTTLVIASAIENKCIEKSVSAALPRGKQRVALFDTEQDISYVNVVKKRITDLSDVNNPLNLDVFSLREHSYRDCFAMIELYLKENNDVGLLVIDGIRDLVGAINNEEEAFKISRALLRWTKTYNVHIMTVLHQNKGDSYARGHLGSELVNKAENVISLTAKNRISEVRSEFSRYLPFEPFAFDIDEEGLPRRDLSYIIGSGGGKKVTDPNRMSKKENDRILELIKERTNKPANSELLKAIKESVEKVTGNSIGDTKAKEFKAFYAGKGWIERLGKSHSPNGYYIIKTEGVSQSEKSVDIRDFFRRDIN